MVRCPFCGYEADVSGFSLLRNPWRYRFYEVRMLECPRCGRVFNYYRGESPKTKRASEFVVRVRPRGEHRE